MEAKDTVMSSEQREKFIEDEYATRQCTIWDMDGLLEAQAKISFKAGIMEAIEWLKLRRKPHLYLGRHNETCTWWEINIDDADWQAKLEEWGCTSAPDATDR